MAVVRGAVKAKRAEAYTSDRRLYLNAQGEVVEADDPGRVRLLVGEGGTLPRDAAVRYGLAEAEEGEAAEPVNAEGADAGVEDDEGGAEPRTAAKTSANRSRKSGGSKK